MYQENKDKQTGETTSIKRVSDGACIPIAPGNSDYEEYLRWVAAGNAPAPDSEWEAAKTLPSLQYRQGHALWEAMQAYIYSKYDAGIQLTFTARYVKLMNDPALNGAKLAALDSVDAFIKSILVYYYEKKSAISLTADIVALDKIAWDFPLQFDASNPKVTIPEVI